jgi:hypothetical protein
MDKDVRQLLNAQMEQRLGLPPVDEETKAVEAFVDAAEALITATTEDPVLSDRTESAAYPECRERQAKALLSEMALRHAAEDTLREAQMARDQALEAMDAAIRERDAMLRERNQAVAERDARVLDEALRAQRVDVEALRAKVEQMRKNLVAVDARADERFAGRLAEKQAACERLLAEQVEAERQASRAARERGAAAEEELAAVRFGEAIRRETINAAMELIWATGRADRGAPRNDRELVSALKQMLSAARMHAQ